MCTILDPIMDKKNISGYKIVICKNNKYYSPVTGIEYKQRQQVTPVRKVSEVRKTRVVNVFKSFDRILSDYTFYEPKMHGKTGVFVEERNAKSTIYSSMASHNPLLKVVKMTISKDLHHSLMNEYKTIVGSFIESIEEI